VLSGLAVLADGSRRIAHAETLVRFRALTDAELDAYVASGEWEGRAGGYAIQGLGAGLVTGIEGDYANVVGLPVALLVETLAAVGYPPLAGKPAAGG
jgi:septum formation protein